MTTVLILLLFHERSVSVSQILTSFDMRSSHSSFSIETVLRVGRPELDSPQRQGIFLLTTASRPALEITQPLFQHVPGALFLVVKRS